MQHMRFLLGLAAPLALLAGPALAQQVVPPAGPEPSGASGTHQTRALENQIEEYPGPSDGVRDESDVDTRIPEQIRPAPRPNAGARPHAASPAAPSSRSGAAASTAIDPSEVQRVFGSDTGVVALGALDPASITQLQVRLRERGHDPGPVDGVVGPKTRAALEDYARAQFNLKQRLLQQDQLTTDLAEQLGVAAGSRRGAQPSMRDDARPAMPPGDAPLLPPGGAPLPPPGMAPLPTPSSSPSGGLPAPRGGATPSNPPPSP